MGNRIVAGRSVPGGSAVGPPNWPLAAGTSGAGAGDVGDVGVDCGGANPGKDIGWNDLLLSGVAVLRVGAQPLGMPPVGGGAGAGVGGTAVVGTDGGGNWAE